MGHQIQIKIYYEDTDCGGVIYYANYLRYLERARTEFMESCGLSLQKLKEQGMQFIVRHVDIDYLFPGQYGNILNVKTYIEEAKGIKIVFDNKISNKETFKLLAHAKTTLVCINNDFKPTRIPKDIIEKIK